MAPILHDGKGGEIQESCILHTPTGGIKKGGAILIRKKKPVGKGYPPVYYSSHQIGKLLQLHFRCFFRGEKRKIKSQVSLIVSRSVHTYCSSGFSLCPDPAVYMCLYFILFLKKSDYTGTF